MDTLHRILKPGGGGAVYGSRHHTDRRPHLAGHLVLVLERGIGQASVRDLQYPNAVDVRVFGNVLSATAFLHGLADKDLKTGELDVYDPEYPVTITVAARKLVVRTTKNL